MSIEKAAVALEVRRRRCGHAEADMKRTSPNRPRGDIDFWHQLSLLRQPHTGFCDTQVGERHASQHAENNAAGCGASRHGNSESLAVALGHIRGLRCARFHDCPTVGTLSVLRQPSAHETHVDRGGGSTQQLGPIGFRIAAVVGGPLAVRRLRLRCRLGHVVELAWGARRDEGGVCGPRVEVRVRRAEDLQPLRSGSRGTPTRHGLPQVS